MPEYPEKKHTATGNIESCGARYPVQLCDKFDKPKCVLQIEVLERCKTARVMHDSACFPEWCFSAKVILGAFKILREDAMS